MFLSAVVFGVLSCVDGCTMGLLIPFYLFDFHHCFWPTRKNGDSTLCQGEMGNPFPWVELKPNYVFDCLLHEKWGFNNLEPMRLCPFFHCQPNMLSVGGDFFRMLESIPDDGDASHVDHTTETLQR